ncbi:MAG: glycosyltransferase family 2 protein [Acidobacteriota bacterium]
MRLSIVSTLYRSAAYLDEFHRRVSNVARELAGEDYEIIFVNDGSPDESLSGAVRIAERDHRVVVVDLARNFGHHRAMMIGLGQARGERVFLIDSDLEEEPEWLIPFDQQMRAEAVDVVYGVQAARKGALLERVSGWLFYRVFRALTGVAQPDNVVTARLMSRRYLDALLAHEERELNIGGLWVTTGFEQARRTVVKHQSSPTTYTWRSKFNLLINAVASFSSRPLVFVFYIGLFISFSASLFIVGLIIQYFFITRPISGYTSVIASIWLFSGLIILFLGIQGIYLAKIFIEVKQRPYSIIRHIYRVEKR